MPELSERDIPRALLRELPRLKQEHGHIYAVQTAGGIYAVRALNWREFRHAQQLAQSEVLPESDIALMGLVWPEEIPDDAPAGVFHTLSLVIFNVSGFENPVSLDAALAWADSELDIDVEHTLIMTICKAFPAYKPEDLYELPFLDLMIRFKQAERMLGMDPAQVVMPGQEPVQQQVRRPRMRARQPIESMEEDVMVFGDDLGDHAPPQPPREDGYDPLRDPDLPPPDFEADNRWFRQQGFVNDATRVRHPGEV